MITAFREWVEELDTWAERNQWAEAAAFRMIRDFLRGEVTPSTPDAPATSLPAPPSSG